MDETAIDDGNDDDDDVDENFDKKKQNKTYEFATNNTIDNGVNV